jgi:GDP-4-dehydro-6-deoxy-D-mannose reductase
MDRVLVTGASGFIGSHLVPRLRDDGHEVITTTRETGDVAEAATWKSFPAADVVIHLAGRLFVPDSWVDPGSFMRTNLLGTVAALDYCRTRSARLVFPSSYMYGAPARLPIPETAPVFVTNPYALSKKAAEDACTFFANSFGIGVTILRQFNVYGPLQSDDFLIPSIVKQAISSPEIRVKDIAPRRDYVYVRDVVDAIVKSIRGPRNLRLFNIGSGVSHSVAEVIRAVQDVWGTSLPVRSEELRRKDEVMDTVADIALAQRELGWQPRFSLRQGLEDMRRESAVHRA